jgi:thioredoxin reductase
MKQITTDIAIVGAGPAGLSAAIQASRAGAKVILLDENNRPGGQLFKQIHKFFGSREHHAGIRGYTIGEELLDDVKSSGAEVMLDSVAYGIFEDNILGVVQGKDHYSVKAKKVILACGAKENYMGFPGSALPGVMGAGAAQTMINVNRVLPGERVLMIGSGNVGLIVSYQLMQAGAEVVGIVEAAPKIGGYGVHAGKISRAGVPLMLGHTVKEVYGKEVVEGAIITKLDENWNQIPGSEMDVKVDTVCLAVGLNAMTELAWMAGCEFGFIPTFGGHVPLHDANMKTTVNGLYLAGDISGVEEASSAMEEGNIAGVSAAEALGVISKEDAQELKSMFTNRINILRSGMFGEKRRNAKSDQLEKMREYMDTL